MKTGVLYATKSGAAEICANKLAQEIEDCTAVNINEQQADVRSYERVILGSGIRMGRVYGPMKKFMKQELEALLDKPVWLYFCGIDTKGFLETVQRNVPEGLCQAAKAIVLMGGKPPFKPSEEEAPPWLDEDAFEGFVSSVQSG